MDKKTQIKKKYQTRYGTDAPITPALNPAHQKALGQIAQSKTVEAHMRRSLGKLNSHLGGLTENGATPEETGRVQSRIDQITKDVAGELEKRRAMTDVVSLHQKKVDAQTIADRAYVKAQRFTAVTKRLKNVLQKDTSPDQQKRANAMMEQIMAMKSEHATKTKEAITRATADPMENLSECSHLHLQEFLAAKIFKPYRTLHLQEERADLSQTNDYYNERQKKLEKELHAVVDREISAYVEKSKPLLTKKDLAAIYLLSLQLVTEIRTTVKTYMSHAYDYGKKAASKELGVRPVKTPLKDIQVRNVDVNDIVDTVVAALYTTARATAKAGIVAEASTPGIVKAIQTNMVAEANKIIPNISGTVIAQSMNKGRNVVFNYNITQIDRFLRTEVLDDVTCNVCMSLDERVVKADDPITKLTQIHNNCRGEWVPVLADDENKPDFNPVPKSVLAAFNTIEGTPYTNGFKQLKKPVNAGNDQVQSLIKAKK